MKRSQLPHVLLLAIALLLLPGCAAYFAAHASSPWETGVGARVNPGFAAGTSGLTVHPVLGYTYLSFDGGHDAVWELGGQVRRPFASGFWVGGELVAARLSTSYDGDYADDYSSNGWALTALAGIPLARGRWGVGAFAGAGISHYTEDMGKNVRVGIEVLPPFLKAR